MTGCVTKPKNKIVFPPKPQREQIPEIQTLEDCAYVINYYEHLVQEWEAWGVNVEEITGVEK